MEIIWNAEVKMIPVITIIRIVTECYRNHFQTILMTPSFADNTNNNVTTTSSSLTVTPKEGAASYSTTVIS
jgi:hypothetical protein